MRTGQILQDESIIPDQEITACRTSTLAEREIKDLLDSIPWEPGQRIRVPKLARALGRSVESLHRGRLTGNAYRRADGSRGRTHLVMTKVLGEFYVSRAALETYVLELNGMGGPVRTVSTSSTSRTSAQRRAAVERANREAAALGC